MKRLQNVVLVLVAMASLSRLNAAEVIYFLVQMTPGWSLIMDSAVIPLSDMSHIAHARTLISSGAYTNDLAVNRYPSVRVAFGKDGINRNYMAPGSPEWSWHVISAGGFGDAATEERWNTAAGVEAIYRTNSNYGPSDWYLLETVVRELGPAPTYLSVALQGQGLEFSWSTPATNYAYTLEAKDSLTANNWHPVPGVPWPLKTNRWSLPTSEATAPFYRIRAEPSAP